MTSYQGDDMGRKQREYTYEEYVKAMELLEKGYGLTETCRLLGWSEKRASYYIIGNMENINLQ